MMQISKFYQHFFGKAMVGSGMVAVGKKKMAQERRQTNYDSFTKKSVGKSDRESMQRIQFGNYGWGRSLETLTCIIHKAHKSR